MRKIIIQEFITLDGVMQAPGGPEEDTSNGFNYGGWTAPYASGMDEMTDVMKQWMESTDILLGRKTFEIFANYWPEHADMWSGIMDVTKYVVSDTITEPEVSDSAWKNSVLLRNVDDIKKLKETDGLAIKVHGSGNLAQTLFKYDLIDEMRLMTFPVTLGSGNRLFAEGTIPAAFKMTSNAIASNGIIFASYERAGEVKTGVAGA
jgi:dihydrofolate reductase